MVKNKKEYIRNKLINLLNNKKTKYKENLKKKFSKKS
jgi:hypothetical protein